MDEVCGVENKAGDIDEGRVGKEFTSEFIAKLLLRLVFR